jgi:hypothetical protein
VFVIGYDERGQASGFLRHAVCPAGPVAAGHATAAGYAQRIRRMAHRGNGAVGAQPGGGTVDRTW